MVKYTCERCGFGWFPRRQTDMPLRCANPKCRTPYWNVPRKNGQTVANPAPKPVQSYTKPIHLPDGVTRGMPTKTKPRKIGKQPKSTPDTPRRMNFINTW